MEQEIAINNTYDYSNLIPKIEPILVLVNYMYQVYSELLRLINEDEEKNAKLKMEYKEYMYKKTYDTKFEVNIKKNDSLLNSINCVNFDSFNEQCKNKQINNIDSLSIELNLSYKRGKELEYSNYINIFKVVFKPYDIKFFRKSNHSEQIMDNVENNIKAILKQFNTENTIFCTKE